MLYALAEFLLWVEEVSIRNHWFESTDSLTRRFLWFFQLGPKSFFDKITKNHLIAINGYILIDAIITVKVFRFLVLTKAKYKSTQALNRF
jgi:hypothetical protein